MSPIENPRLAARWKIIQAANKRALARHRRSRLPHKPLPRMLGMRNVQEAVCRARRFGLVDDATLVAAGFRASRDERRTA